MNIRSAILIVTMLRTSAAAFGAETSATRPADSPAPGTLVLWGGGTMSDTIAARAKHAMGGEWTVVQEDDRLPTGNVRSRLWVSQSLNSETVATLRSARDTGTSIGGSPDLLRLIDVSPAPGSSPQAVDRLSLYIPPGTLVVIAGRRISVDGQDPVTWRLPPANVQDGLDRPAEFVQKVGDVMDLVQLQRATAIRKANAFPTARPASPEVKSGSLLLCGGGDLPDAVWQRFIDLAGGVDSPIVFITTAQPDPFESNPKGIDRLRTLGAKHITVFGHRELRGDDATAFYKALKQAKGVWLMGGRQWRYIDAYEATRVPELLHDVLARGGVVGGSSAGAAIQAELMVRGNPISNRVMFDEAYLNGFKFLPGTMIDIHVSERGRLNELTKAVEAFPGYVGLAIDEGTAGVVTGSQLTVIGAKAVRVVRVEPQSTKATVNDYRAGETASLRR